MHGSMLNTLLLHAAAASLRFCLHSGTSQTILLQLYNELGWGGGCIVSVLVMVSTMMPAADA